MKLVKPSLIVFLGLASSAFSQSTWTLQFTGVADSMTGVAYGNGRFGAISRTRVITSPDGGAWTPSGPSGSILYSDDRAIDYTGTHWFARGFSGNGKAYLSSTLPTNMAHIQLPGSGNEVFRAAAFGNGTLVVVGWNGQIRASQDNGATWLIAASPSQDSLVDVVFDGSSFVALGEASTILQSTTGLIWSLKSTPGSLIYKDLEFGQGVYVAVGSKSMHSPDLVNWTVTSPGSLNAVEYADGRFVAVGDQGRILVSSNGGASWNPVASGVTANLQGIAYGEGFWVAVGGSGVVIRAGEDGVPPQPIGLAIHPAVEVRWHALASKTYQVKWSYDMDSWFDFGAPIDGDGNMQSVFDATRDAGKKFYRVVESDTP